MTHGLGIGRWRRALAKPARGVVVGLVLAVALALPASPPPAADATATSRVFVTIVGTASAVSTVTNLQVGLSDAAPETATDTGTATTEANPDQVATGAPPPTASQPTFAGSALDLGSETNFPGSFAVVGESNQVFSVQMPDLVVLDIGGDLVELTGFQHNGGSTPVADANGILEISFSAEVNRDQASILQNLVPAAGTPVDSNEIVILQVAPPPADTGAGATPPAAGTVASPPGAQATAGASEPGGDGTAVANDGTETTTDGTETGEEGGGNNIGGQPASGPARIAVRVTDPFGLPTNNSRQVVIVISFN